MSGNTVPLDALMKSSPEDLAQIQFTYLNSFVISRLKDVVCQLEVGRIDYVINDYLFLSPAGDGYGTDSECIDFSESGYEDLGSVLRRLKELKEMARGK